MLILFSFAFSNETISYFSKTIGNTSIDWISDFDCEGESSQSEKSGKNEKLNFSEDLILNTRLYNNKLLSDHFAGSASGSSQNINFSSSDYSQQVYSPPELI